jgi:hypothetical protein
MDDRVTVDDIMYLNPCTEYPSERVEEIFAGRESLALTEICDLDLPPEDVIWTVSRLADPETLTAWVQRVADRSVERFAVNNPRISDWAERWLSGEDRSVEAADVAVEASTDFDLFRSDLNASKAARAARAARWASKATDTVIAADVAANTIGPLRRYAAQANAAAAYAAGFLASKAWEDERLRQLADMRDTLGEAREAS